MTSIEEIRARLAAYQPPMLTSEPCPHCPDGHRPPNSKPWGAHLGLERDGDGQPTHIRVERPAGEHVAESDAEWMWSVLRIGITATDLAFLLAEIDRLNDDLDAAGNQHEWIAAARAWRRQCEKAEAALARVGALAERWDILSKGPSPTTTAIRSALDGDA